MAYFLVMGGLALSVSFTLGWMLVRSSQWLMARLPGGSQPKNRAARRTPARKAPAKTSTTSRVAGPRGKGIQAAEPWGITRWLAGWRFAWPLSLLALLLYGLTRLVEYGMTQRPSEPPVAFHGLVASLGWIAAVLLGLALINLFAAWRCRRR